MILCHYIFAQKSAGIAYLKVWFLQQAKETPVVKMTPQKTHTKQTKNFFRAKVFEKNSKILQSNQTAGLHKV